MQEAAAAAAAGEQKPEPVVEEVVQPADDTSDPLFDVDEDEDPNDLPDSILKYKTILKRARKGMGKFTDANFDKDEPSTIIG